MNDYVISPNGVVCMYRYFTITLPGYERPTREEFEELRQNGYEYKGASSCFSDSIYFFEFKHDNTWHEVQARSATEALEKVNEGR